MNFINYRWLVFHGVIIFFGTILGLS